jgi:hypothetical protein
MQLIQIAVTSTQKSVTVWLRPAQMQNTMDLSKFERDKSICKSDDTAWPIKQTQRIRMKNFLL